MKYKCRIGRFYRLIRFILEYRMASSRRSYDTDTITLRTVFARYTNNSNIPALRTLTSDGAGGTYWAIPSSLGILPAFNKIDTSDGSFTADLSYNTFGLYAAEGQGMYKSGSNLNLYSKAFTQFDISGENMISAYSNYRLNSRVNLAGEGAISLRADPATNTIFINGPASQFISTPTFAFNQIKFIENVSSLSPQTGSLFGSYITANSPSTTLAFAGQGDLLFSTNVTTNTVVFSISTFTSRGFLDISANVYSFSNTISSLQYEIGSNTSSISSINAFISTSLNDNLQSSILALAISTGAQFYLLSGQINARATIIQVNDDIANVNTNIVSTGRGLISRSSWVFSSTSSITGQVLNVSSTPVSFLTIGPSTVSSLNMPSGLYSYINDGEFRNPNTSDVENLYLNGGAMKVGLTTDTVISDNDSLSTVNTYITASIVPQAYGGWNLSGFLWLNVNSPGITSYLYTDISSPVSGLTVYYGTNRARGLQLTYLGSNVPIQTMV